jgi:large subunit ribosomal protein L28
VKNPLQRRQGGDLGSHLPKHVIPKDAYIPAYPYGDHQLFKQANKGLYGEQMIRFGNNVSKETETKTRRYWKPNVLSKALYSVALKKKIKLRITAKVLKIVDREGGLDEYLLKDSVARIKELGPMGWALRWTLMQKPEVVMRLRADAAALGIDQATIDKQWPTPEIMADLRAAQRESAQDVETGSLENQEFAETEEQEMWAPIDAEAPQPTSKFSGLSKEEDKVARNAATEYTKVIKAAERYLSRGVVDSKEQGIKLAFVRANEREEAAARLKQTTEKKYAEMNLTASDLQEIRTRFNLPDINDRGATKIAYNQRKRQQIDEAGGLEAWKASVQAEKAASLAKRAEEAGGPEAFLANRKAEYADLIQEAETASTNLALDPQRRSYLQHAIYMANRAVQAEAAGGQDAFVQWAVDKFRTKKGSKAPAGSAPAALKQIARDAKQEVGAGGDAWGALVHSSNRPVAESRPNA